MTLPTGTITFLRTDVEGSMALVRTLGADFDELDAAHRAIVRAAIDAHGGRVVRTEGDAFHAVYTDTLAGARTAVDIQRGIAAHPWPAAHPFRIRIGLHAGAAHLAGDDYGGFEVSRAARVASVGWGGQIVISEPVRALLDDRLPEGWTFVDLGRHRLAGVSEPQRLYQLCAPGLATAFPPLRTSTADADHLPPRLTSLVGREDELATLDGLLAGTRILTLTGPGGTGKTTLALELARRAASSYADGAWFVGLEAVADEEPVRAEIAHGLGLLDGAAGSAAERLLDYVRDRELLVTIDNFEQVARAAGVVSEIVRASPRSRVIVTSRVPLRIGGEQEYQVRPLSVDGGSGSDEPEAVRLFLARARNVRPDLHPDEADLAAIAAICRQLDGLPLAIELAAARVRMLPVEVIRDRLAAHLPLPGSGPRDLPERQRTIENTVAWSHGLLDEPQQRLFARISIFEQSFDLEQAEFVGAADAQERATVVDGLMTLVEHSLIHPADETTGAARYRMLETVRAFGRARLDASAEADEVRDRHVGAYADLAERAGPMFQSGQQGWWLDRLEADDANLRAATSRAIARPLTRDALRLVGGLWRYWLQSGRLAEGRALAHAAVVLPGVEDWPSERLRALDAAGGVEYWSGDPASAGRIYEEELVLARQSGDRQMEAQAYLNLFFTRDFGEDRSASDEARVRAEAIYRELNDERGLRRVQMAVPLVLFARTGPLGRDDGAPGESPLISPEELDAMADVLAGLEDPWEARAASLLRTLAAWQRSDLPTAARWFGVGLRDGLAVREPTDVALAMQYAIVASVPMGEPLAGATIHGALLTAFERLGIVPPASYADLGGDPMPTLVALLGQEAFDGAVERGRRMSLEEATAVFEEATAAFLARTGAPS